MKQYYKFKAVKPFCREEDICLVQHIQSGTRWIDIGSFFERSISSCHARYKYLVLTHSGKEPNDNELQHINDSQNEQLPLLFLSSLNNTPLEQVDLLLSFKILIIL